MGKPFYADDHIGALEDLLMGQRGVLLAVTRPEDKTEHPGAILDAL